jgi:hypothetical protein
LQLCTDALAAAPAKWVAMQADPAAAQRVPDRAHEIAMP